MRGLIPCPCVWYDLRGEAEVFDPTCGYHGEVNHDDRAL